MCAAVAATADCLCAIVHDKQFFYSAGPSSASSRHQLLKSADAVVLECARGTGDCGDDGAFFVRVTFHVTLL
jgi:hypothetical protein